MHINKLKGKDVLLILLSIALFSCNKYLEIIPTDQVSDPTVWSDAATTDLFLNGIYSRLPNQSGEPLDNFSDDGINGINQVSGSRTLYATSIYTPSNVPNNWAAFYSNIRNCNTFIEKVTTSKLPDSWKIKRLAEARFLRAYYYQSLWIWHGGVPIITKVLDRNTQGDSIFMPRSTSDETFTFITNELAAIVNDLPLKAEAGRASQGAALALKGWCELFEASPLKNLDNDKSKWALSAVTYKKVMDLGIYSLFPDYNTLFFEENNNSVETIFAKKYLGGTSLGNSKVAQIGPTFVFGTAHAFANSNPTQELVDSYLMANGRTITDPLSGYDTQNPYLNREKRFYQSIVYDGSFWLGDQMIMKQGVGSRNATDLGDRNESSNTGYYWRKGLDEKYATINNNQNSADFIIFRYAEVLLGYAEAQNEVSGPDEGVYNAINKVRERSALPALQTGLNQEEMRTAIHRERRVEFAIEGKRWYDLLRWKIAEKNLNGPLHAISIKDVNGKWVYSSVPAAVGLRVFYPEKNYVLPIPQAAMDRNSKLVQNEGY